MSVFTQVTVTELGKSLLASVGVGNTVLTFSSIKTSSNVYNPEELESLESIDEKQTVSISGKSIVNSTNVKLHSIINNSSLADGYYIRTIGIYALDGENEILYGVTQETSGNCYMPQSSLTNTAFDFSIVLTVSNAKNVSVITDPSGVVTLTHFNETVNKKMEWCGTYNSSNNYKNNDVIIYNDAYYKVNDQLTGNMDFSKVTFLGIKSKYDHFTMEIDGNNNANPSVENGCIKYRDGCENFSKQDWVDWFGYKPCIMYSQGGIECYLDPNNYSEDVNGNNVDVSTISDTTRNVMIEYKRIGINSQSTGIGKWIIRCTDDPCDNRYSYVAFENGSRNLVKFYVGAYNGTVANSKLHSLSNSTIATSGNSLSSYRTLAQANGANYTLLDCKKFSFLRHLFIVQNGTVNGTISKGCKGTNTTSGVQNTSGMNIDNTTYWGKWLGLETNCFSEFIDGIYIDSNTRLLIANNDNYNNTGSGYEDCGKVFTLRNGYMGVDTTFSEKLGFIPNNTSGTAESIFHAATKSIKASSCMINYGYNLFYNHFTESPKASLTGVTARLCYNRV